jgi:acetoin utilization deacetylase AcuC-like enzyme
VKVFTSDQHEVPLPPGHRFPMGKYAALRRRLLERCLLGAEDLVPAEPAPREALERAHDPAYVRAFLDGSIDDKAMRKIGFPWSEALVRRTLASAGGTLAAMRAARQDGIAGNLAGGTHHAAHAEGSGFCVFNDLAVAAHAALADGVERVLIVDVDVHQGDGTAKIFAGEPAVFTLSLHGAKNFPFKKPEGSLDVELPDGTGDEAYLMVLVPALRQAFAACDPQLVLVQAGVDALAEDKLGRLNLTLEGLKARDEQILGLCRERGVPTVLTLGGGYAEPISVSVEAHAGTYEVARRVFG